MIPMPRLIAVEGPESGLALPITGEQTYLGTGTEGQVRLVRGGDPPSTGAAIIRVGAESYDIERLGTAGGVAPALFVNGEEVERAPLNHGDLITFGGVTLIFDCEDHGLVDTTPGESIGRTAGARSESAAAQSAVEPEGPVAGAALAAEPDYRDGADRARNSGRISEARTAARERPSPDTEPPIPTPPPPLLGGESIRYRRKAFEDAGALLRAVKPVDETEHRLATLLRVSSALGATLDIGALLRMLLDLVFEEIPADRGTILLFERPAKKLRSMVSRVRPGVSDDRPRVSRTIIKEALRSRESILTLDAMSDERFQLGASVAAARIRSAMCVPIIRSGRVLGVLHLDTEHARAFTREDLDLVTAIASMGALAIENARLYQEAAERERLRYELELATGIQQRLLPKWQPRSPDLDVFGRMVPAKELGGDYYDFIEDEGGTLHVLVGDVSGKGVGAGLIMAIARSYFRPLARSLDSPRKVFSEVNRLLYDDTNREIFMSALYLRWDGQAKRLVYSGAGQEHLLVVRANRTCEAVPAGGVALALMEDAANYFEDKVLDLAAGDTVVLYTDGVTDARDPNGKFFGLERLKSLAEQAAQLASAREVVERIVAEVRAYQDTAEQHDDITVVALKRKS